MAARILEQLGAKIRAGLFSFLELSPNEEREARLKRAVDDLRARLGRLIAERRLLEKEAEVAALEADALAGKADAAISLGRDDLARAVVRANARRSERGDALAAELRAIAIEATALEDELRALGADGDLGARLAELDALIRDARPSPDKET